MELRKLLKLALWGPRGLLFLAMIAGAVSGGANALLIIVTHRSLSGGEVPGSPLVAFVIAGVLLVAARALSIGAMSLLPGRAIHRFRMNLARQVLSLPLEQLEHHGPGRVQALLTQDVAAASLAIVVLPGLIITFVSIIGNVGYLVWMSWRLGLAAAIFLVLGFGFHALVRRNAARILALSHAKQDQLFKKLLELSRGAKELRLSTQRRQQYVEALAAASEGYHETYARGMSRLGYASVWGELAFQLMLCFVLFFAPRWLPGVSHDVQTGSVFIVLSLMAQLVSITTLVPALVSGSASLRRIEGFALNLTGGTQPSKASDEVKRACAELELSGVTHSYRLEKDGSSFHLGPIDLRLRAGELVFLIGGNGSGKTTLAKLITGLYAPEAGVVRKDGQPVDEHARDEYRQLFSVVFAEFHVFEELPPATDLARAAEYLKMLELDHKVQIRDGAFTTLNLSTGQRKRLALLIAYLEDRPVYIFDEWAADQDPVFKEVFYTRLLPELRDKGKVILAITHDDRYFALADRLVKLESGRIVSDEQRTPAVTPVASGLHK